MSHEHVAVELSDGALWLTLDRPERRNALDQATVEALLAALERAELDAGVRVVVLQGAGNDFCAGADLQELLVSVDRPQVENEAEARRLGEVFIRMRGLPKPVIALVRGRALAGGCGLATACDIVLAHAGATLGYPETQRGFVPAMVMAMLRRTVGEKTAFDLVATGRLLTADEALSLGLVSRVIPEERFEQETRAVVRQLAATSGSALALTKRLLYEMDGRSFEDAISLGARVNAVARTTPDFRDALRRFLKA